MQHIAVVLSLLDPFILACVATYTARHSAVNPTSHVAHKPVDHLHSQSSVHKSKGTVVARRNVL